MPTVNLPIILRCIPLDQGRELGYKQIEPMQGCGEYVTSTPFGFESRIFLILPLTWFVFDLSKKSACVHWNHDIFSG